MPLAHPYTDPHIVYTIEPTPLGDVVLAARDMHLMGVWFDHQQHQPQTSAWSRVNDHPVLERAQQQLQQYLDGQRQQFDLPVTFVSGTPFQQQVWSALQSIPYGRTVSYSEMAERVSRPRAVRAVGAAIGRNPLSMVIPCHRVVGANGALTGYAGGLARKQALLALEATPL
jgi:methylated-DNA-[protein]-cysteine S-methyltransferase